MVGSGTEMEWVVVVEGGSVCGYKEGVDIAS